MDTIDQIIYQKMKEEKLYLYKEAHEPKMGDREAEHFDKVLAASAERSKEAVVNMMATPNSTQIT